METCVVAAHPSFRLLLSTNDAEKIRHLSKSSCGAVLRLSVIKNLLCVLFLLPSGFRKASANTGKSCSSLPGLLTPTGNLPSCVLRSKVIITESAPYSKPRKRPVMCPGNPGTGFLIGFSGIFYTAEKWQNTAYKKLRLPTLKIGIEP